jgi:DNA-binding MarR family transcriptional regulator
MKDFVLQRRIKGLTREVAKLGDALEKALARIEAPRSERSGWSVSNLELAESMLESRRLREDLFGAEMFADPAWDMLLHLFVNAERGQSVPVSYLCAASAVPQSTALRWIDTLANAGFVDRRPDPKDRRRVPVSLAPTAANLMRLHLRRTRASLLMLADPDEPAGPRRGGSR